MFAKIVPLLLSLPLVAATSGACADPAITGAVGRQVGTNGNLNAYDVAITVKNLGTAAERSSLLQSVQVFQDGNKVGQIGTTPLASGASTTVHYKLTRSSDARPGTTTVRLHLVLRDPHGNPVTDCNTGNDDFRLRV